MSHTDITFIIRDAIVTALILAAPFLAVTAFIGLFIAFIQAATQIQEQSIPFIIKIVSVGLILVFLGAWLIYIIMDFAQRIFQNINGLP